MAEFASQLAKYTAQVLLLINDMTSESSMWKEAVSFKVYKTFNQLVLKDCTADAYFVPVQSLCFINCDVFNPFSIFYNKLLQLNET